MTNPQRTRNMPSKLKDYVIPDYIKNIIIQAKNNSQCSQADSKKVQSFYQKLELANDTGNVMNDLDKVMKRLNLQGGNGPNEGNNNVESQESPAEGLALLITAINQLPLDQPLDELDQPPAAIDQQPALVQPPAALVQPPTNQDKLFGYATRFYNTFLTTVNNCIKNVWNDTLKASLASYVGGKLALMTISNPGNISSFIKTLMTTIAPYASAATGILSTVALGTLIRKVFGHYATTTALIAEETKDGILALNTKILTMSDKEVVEALIDQTSNLSRATNDLFQSLKNTRPTDYDALARSLPEIDFNLDKRDKINVGDFANAKRRKINNDPSTVAPTTVAPTTVAGLDAGTMEESDDEESNTAATTTVATTTVAPTTVAGLDAGTMEESDDEESNTAATTTTTGPATGKRKAEEISTSTGSGKRKSKKRQTKNKKNKARKTKKNKRSSKKKVHKKK